MKLSISNIAWAKENDEEMYEYISQSKFDGIEIAPTKIIQDNPYFHIEEAKDILEQIYNKYKLKVSSMQSIWYGRQGNIFDKEEAKKFIEYTQKAIDFAHEINCGNLVFGCPKNRIMPQGNKEEDVIYFFRELGEYAKQKQTVLSIEPNPTIYGTNFINYTSQALEFVKKINSEGIKVNVDFGTIIENKENLELVFKNLNFVNHIHISEPNLTKIEKREEHIELAEYLKKANYNKYVSIEMKDTGNIDDVKETIEYINKIFK
ncbi:MAG: sugar phosphate isomerase/epimerase [Clostridia bacterium]|nr:sugar phosphate isomerase/epimerase [Clostridia bacterium]